MVRTFEPSPPKPRPRRTSKVPWFFVAPALLLYLGLVVYPLISGAVVSFTDWRGLSPERNWVGWANFERLWADPQVQSALRNTLLLALAITVVQNSLGLLLALGLNSHIYSRNVLRTLFFAPVVISPLIIGFLWQYLYNPVADAGLNGLLAAFGLEALQQNWLGNPNLALWSVANMVIWQSVGFSMVVFLAGLQGVPQELLEAAEIDGASPAQRFWRVTLPLLAPAITINVVLSIIGSMRLFDHVLATTGGGPGYATETLTTALYKQAFVIGHYAYGSAIALLLAALIVSISIVQLRILRSREVEV